MAKTKGTKGGPHIKNAHLIGKGGGQVKPVDGSWAKGALKARKSPAKPKPSIKKHISTTPAKLPTPGPGRGRSLSAKPTPKVTMSKATPVKKTMPKVKPTPAKPKAAPKKAKSLPVKPPQVKSRPAPKKAAPTKVKKGPSKGR